MSFEWTLCKAGRRFGFCSRGLRFPPSLLADITDLQSATTTLATEVAIAETLPCINGEAPKPLAFVRSAGSTLCVWICASEYACIARSSADTQPMHCSCYNVRLVRIISPSPIGVVIPKLTLGCGNSCLHASQAFVSNCCSVRRHSNLNAAEAHAHSWISKL